MKIIAGVSSSIAERASPGSARETLYSYHREYGYSPYSLIAISEQAAAWEAKGASGAVAYLPVGSTWLAAEPLAAESDLAQVANGFLEFAKSQRCFPVFVPVTERFARVGIDIGLHCAALGKSPYFDLSTWNREGRKLHTVRKELNKSRRAGVNVECVPGAELPIEEVKDLARVWLGSRRTSGLSWVFAPGTLHVPEYQRHFLARDSSGKLVGLLSAAPLPARRGYYFKDLQRCTNVPKGTADALMVCALEHLGNEGAILATPGAVPILDIQSREALANGHYPVSMGLLRLLEKIGNRFYNVSGLLVFKRRFGPNWWEYEYALGPRASFGAVKTGVALLRAAMPGGLLNAFQTTAFRT